MSEIVNGFLSRVVPSTTGGGNSLLGFVNAERDREFQRERQEQEFGLVLEELGLRRQAQRDTTRQNDRRLDLTETEIGNNHEVGMGYVRAQQTQANSNMLEARSLADQRTRQGQNDRYLMAQEQATRQMNEYTNRAITRLRQSGGNPDDPTAVRQQLLNMPAEDNAEFINAALNNPGMQDMFAERSGLAPNTIMAQVNPDNPNEFILVGRSKETGDFTTLTSENAPRSDTNQTVRLPVTAAFAMVEGASRGMSQHAIENTMGVSNLVTAARQAGPTSSQLFASQTLDERTREAANPATSSTVQGFNRSERAADSASRRAIAERTSEIGADTARQMQIDTNTAALEDQYRAQRVDERNAVVDGVSLEAQGVLSDLRLQREKTGDFDQRLREVFSDRTANFDWTQAGLVFDKGFQSIRESDDPAVNRQTGLESVMTALSDPQERAEIAEAAGVDPNKPKDQWTDDELATAVELVMLSARGDRTRGFRRLLPRNSRGQVNESGVRQYNHGVDLPLRERRR